MNTKDIIEINTLPVEIVRKDIKNIHLGVYPPKGRIRVAVPLKTTDESIRLLVISKTSWIKKQKAKFQKQERQIEREYVSGESHYFFGRRYLLNVINIDPNPRIEINRKTHIDLYIKPNSSSKHREKLLDDWYRLQIKKQIDNLLAKWENILKLKVNSISIKKMKTKWGTCSSESKRIWLNLELAKKPIYCLEYVLVHELIHLLESKHSDSFKKIMNKSMPNWEQYKKELNKYPLNHSDWKY